MDNKLKIFVNDGAIVISDESNGFIRGVEDKDAVIGCSIDIRWKWGNEKGYVHENHNDGMYSRGYSVSLMRRLLEEVKEVILRVDKSSVDGNTLRIKGRNEGTGQGKDCIVDFNKGTITNVELDGYFPTNKNLDEDSLDMIEIKLSTNGIEVSEVLNEYDRNETLTFY